MFEPETVSKFFKIVVADLLLAGDNALVIALATRALAPREQFWGRLIGTGGAVGLRVLFIAIIAWMLKIPYVQLVGGVLLLWIAWKLVQPQENSEESHGKGNHAATLAEEQVHDQDDAGHGEHEDLRQRGQYVWQCHGYFVLIL